ncbi:MAG TPA: 5'-3' exonuclease H3TH domain-containing protein [Acidimicrobiales bacterium]|nr:5'-3' exonuclease H3TH domain-containing protein [Acidimicrobiales bacterium]
MFLVDGTYELFRHYHGAPPHQNRAGEEVGATRAVLGSLLGMLEGGASHMGVATDHVIESWRNDVWPGYKSSAGVPANLLSQFGLFEEALASMGLAVWPMTELEADDALASAAAVAAEDPRAEQVLICTPDKDLGQCVRERHVVCLDRRKSLTVDEAAVRARFGVGPGSVPDWLALVGDSADGFPGLPGWGPKAATAVLARYGSIEAVPQEPRATWPVDLSPRRADTLRQVLREGFELALLFKKLATCVVDRGLLPAGDQAVDSLEWHGPTGAFEEVCSRLEAPGLVTRAGALAAKRRAS